jgi:hypothetical protein
MNRKRRIDDRAGKNIVFRRGFRHLGDLASWRLGVELERYRALLLTAKRQGAKSASVDPPPDAIFD